MPKTPDNFSEKEVIAKAKAGQQYYLELLVKNYLPLVYGLAIRYLKNRADAEDVTQEVFIKVWHNLKKIDLDKNFKSWVLEITKNSCLDMLKKKTAIPFSVFDQAEGANYLTDSLLSTDILPPDFVEQSFSNQFFNNLVNKLSFKYQRILSLYYYRGLNFREISEELNEPLDTIKSRHRRAIIRLRKLLNKD